MIADYHVHTPYCGHAHGKIINYVEFAIETGIDEICFSDHLGRYYLSKSQKRRYWDWGMDEKNLGRYFNELSDLQEIFKHQISIKSGLEIDFIEGADELLKPYYHNFKLDFALCSIHCMPKFNWNHISSYSEKNNTFQFYKEYFRLARTALHSDMFDSLAHLDFIWRNVAFPYEALDEILQEITDTVYTASQLNKCLEINANGYLWSKEDHFFGIPDPFIHLLDQIKKYDVRVTIGSDAHDPVMVGKIFHELIPMLVKQNITKINVFSDRIASTVQLC